MDRAARNLALTEDIYARYAQGDPGPLFAALAEDVVWRTEGSGLPWSGSFSGPAGVREYFARLGEACEVCGYEVERLLADPEWVVALAVVQIRFRASRRMESFRKVDAFRLRDGRIVEFREYYDSARVGALLPG